MEIEENITEDELVIRCSELTDEVILLQKREIKRLKSQLKKNKHYLSIILNKRSIMLKVIRQESMLYPYRKPHSAVRS